MSTEPTSRDRIQLQLVVPLHQPLAATDAYLQQCINSVYEPLLQAIEGTTDVRIAVYLGGHLLDHLTRHNERWLFRFKQLVQAGRIELLGGLFYGGQIPWLSETDIRGQLEMSAEYWDSYLGAPPRGFWLPDLHWSPELPRLLEDSSLEYGFVVDSQLAKSPSTGICTVVRGDQQVAAFALDSALSNALPTRPVDEWVDALLDRHAGTMQDDGVVSVWLSGQTLAHTGTAQGDPTWYHELFAALGRERVEVQCVLPHEILDRGVRAEPAKMLYDRLTPRQEGGMSDVVRFACSTADTHVALQRRASVVSEKLREAIALMEEEGLEDSWSDALATAQRDVFAGQAPDVCLPEYRGEWKKSALREAIFNRLLRAETMVDSLLQGDEDWLAAEEQDKDGDLNDEVFVSNAHLSAWLVPACGADVRMLDHRRRSRTLLDVESVYGMNSGAAEESVSARDDATMLDESSNGGHSTATSREQQGPAGIRTWLFDHRTSALEFFAGSALNLMVPARPWEICDNGIHDDDNPRYRLEVKQNFDVEGLSPRQWVLTKAVTVPIDAASIDIEYSARLMGSPEVLLATEIPIRLHEAHFVTADGAEVASTTHELYGVSEMRVRGVDGETIAVAASQPCDWWCQRSNVNSDANEADGGIVLVALMTVHDALESTLSINLI